MLAFFYCPNIAYSGIFLLLLLKWKFFYYLILNYKNGDDEYLNKKPEQLFNEIAINTAVPPEKISPPDKPVIMMKHIGSTTYQVAVHFSKTSHETMSDKISRIIQRETESVVIKKWKIFLKTL